MESNVPHHHEPPEKLENLEQLLTASTSFQQVSDVFRQLSDPTRLRIFWLLCHCEECVLDLSALLGISSPAVSHHLRQLRASGLIVSRRRGKEVCYRASDTEIAALLHRAAEQIMAISCPKDTPGLSAALRLPPNPDAHTAEPVADYPADQLETIHAVHDYLVENLSSRITVAALCRKFLMNAATLQALFAAVYGSSIAAHIRKHRIEAAALLLRDTEQSIFDISRAVGYESQSKFSQEFKKQMNLLPTEYRRRAREAAAK